MTDETNAPTEELYSEPALMRIQGKDGTYRELKRLLVLQQQRVVLIEREYQSIADGSEINNLPYKDQTEYYRLIGETIENMTSIKKCMIAERSKNQKTFTLSDAERINKLLKMEKRKSKEGWVESEDGTFPIRSPFKWEFNNLKKRSKQTKDALEGFLQMLRRADRIIQETGLNSKYVSNLLKGLNKFQRHLYRCLDLVLATEVIMEENNTQKKQCTHEGLFGKLFGDEDPSEDSKEKREKSEPSDSKND